MFHTFCTFLCNLCIISVQTITELRSFMWSNYGGLKFINLGKFSFLLFLNLDIVRCSPVLMYDSLIQGTFTNLEEIKQAWAIVIKFADQKCTWCQAALFLKH